MSNYLPHHLLPRSTKKPTENPNLEPDVPLS
jgi:hypothetical protein